MKIHEVIKLQTRKRHLRSVECFTRYLKKIAKSLNVCRHPISGTRSDPTSLDTQILYESSIEDDAMLFSLQLRDASAPTASAQGQLDYGR